MMDAASDEKIMKLLFEVEQLQRILSEERQLHSEQLKDLQVSNHFINKIKSIEYDFLNYINNFYRINWNLKVNLNKLNYTKRN